MNASKAPDTSNRASSKPDSHPDLSPGRIALITRDWYDKSDWLKGDRWGFGFDGRLAKAIEATGREKPDGIVFGLWTWDEAKDGTIPRIDLFPKGTTHQWVLLETRRSKADIAEVHFRGLEEPAVLYQRFATSQSVVGEKKRFVEELPTRTFGQGLVMLCGESNIIRTKRDCEELDDRFDFLSYLDQAEIRLVLNPIHTYMQRYEMRLKRLAYSQNGRTVLAVWNRGESERGESQLPWAAYCDGEEVTHQIREITDGEELVGVRIGIFDERRRV